MYIFENSGIEKKNDFDFLTTFNNVKNLASGKENVRSPDSPDFVNL